MKAESIEFNGDFSDDLNALVESEATLSDEFKAKTAIIFEAAVKTKLSEEIDRLETEYAEQLAEEVAQTKTDLVEKVDSYLNYVVEQWMEDNKLAIQSGLRAEIAEELHERLKDLFAESYVEVPESKS
jgi:gas vesicle protein